MSAGPDGYRVITDKGLDVTDSLTSDQDTKVVDKCCAFLDSVSLDSDDD